MHAKEVKINWNTTVVYPSKQAFIDAHKEAYPNADLSAEYDKHFAKQDAKPEKAK